MKVIICECGHDQAWHNEMGCCFPCVNTRLCECFESRASLLEARIEELEAKFCSCEFSRPSIESTECDICGMCKKPYLHADMVCGHPLSAVVQADEGTAHCEMCLSEDKNANM